MERVLRVKVRVNDDAARRYEETLPGEPWAALVGDEDELLRWLNEFVFVAYSDVVTLKFVR